MKTSLYIGDRLVDTKEDGLILFNYSSGDVTDPAVVMNSFTQSITLPGTPSNNAIFGHYYRLDRTTPTGGYNALKRIPFQLFNEAGEVLESGYAKLDAIRSDNNGVKEYSVTLFGGLGGFLYGLTYYEDGSKKTLASLTFPNLGDYFTINRNSVKAAWDALNNEDYEDTEYGTINFAPAYNGMPGEFFDYNKAVYKEGTTQQNKLYGIVTSSSGYTPKAGANGAILLEMQNKHTEWEMQEFRSYLQRPILSLRSLIFALADDASRADGYHFEVSPALIASHYISKGWMTLALPKYEYFSNSYTIYSTQLFDGTGSPADYLLALVKMFGLYLHYDSANKTITLMPRGGYYDNVRIDLTGRIERAKDITPYAMDARRYEWKTQEMGAFAKEYEEKFGSSYGSELVTTGYEFNAETKDVLSGIILKGAPEVLESSALFRVFGGVSGDRGEALNYCFKPTFYEDVKWRLYKSISGGTEETEMRVANPVDFGGITYTNTPNKYTDFFVKVQLHGEDNKSEVGQDVLLFFNGTIPPPSHYAGGIAIYEANFRITDDTAEMLFLNSGRPCWDATPANGILCNAIPQFTRFLEGGESHYNLEMGDPKVSALEDPRPLFCGVYSYCWARYLADRYDKDTKVVRARVNLRGLRCDADLLRHFYYFDGVLWVLNKVINHSVTTPDLTECEFIKVADTRAYTNGQNF